MASLSFLVEHQDFQGLCGPEKWWRGLWLAVHVGCCWVALLDLGDSHKDSDSVGIMAGSAQGPCPIFQGHGICGSERPE